MYNVGLEQLQLSQSEICRLVEKDKSTISRFVVQKLAEITKGDDEITKEKRRKYDFSFSQSIIRELYTDSLKPKNKVQVFYNFKGGTGKTSLCHQISVMFALYGFKVLVIDCDPQAHLSYSLGFDEYKEYKTLYDVVVNSIPIRDAIVPVYPGLDAIPSNLSLTRLEIPLNQMANRERVLSKIIEPLKNDYDFIFIDTNPTISTLNRNATLAADMLNIICETQPYSLKGLEILVNEIHSFGAAMEKEINYQIVANKYEVKTATSQEALGSLHHEYKGKVLEVLVRRCEDINISAKKRLPLIGFCDKKSMALEDIIDLTKIMISRSTTKNKGELFDAA